MRILIAGDFSPVAYVKDHIRNMEFDRLFNEIRELTDKSDYSIVNFESTIENPDAMPIAKCGPSLSCPKESAEAIKWAGFNVVTLANNHSLDYGDLGLTTTIEVLRQSNILTVGAGDTIKDASSFLILKNEKINVALINCCEEEFSVATESSAGTNPLRPVHIYNQIQKAKKYSDRIVVITHSGHEHFQLPSLQMQETFRFFIDAGADAVVNHHQHCFSGMEVYNNKPIFYGLGNFCFDSPVRKNISKWNYGYMCQLNFSEVDVTWRVVPYEQCVGNNGVCIDVDRGRFNAEFQMLSDIIADENKLKRKIDQYYSVINTERDYLSILRPFFNKYWNYLVHRGLLPSMVGKRKLLYAYNIINCESHRTPFLNYLKDRISNK